MSIYSNFTEKQLSKLGTPILIREYNEMIKDSAMKDYVTEKRLKPVNGFKTCAEGARRVRVLFDVAFGQRAPKRQTKVRDINVDPPGFDPIPCKAGSKQAALVDALSRENGATISDMLPAVSGGKKAWTEGRLRSCLSWYVKKRGYGLLSREGYYFLVVPVGKTIPPHAVKRS